MVAPNSSPMCLIFSKTASSGSNFFDTETVNAIKHYVVKKNPAYLQGYITEVNRLPKFVENKQGPLKIWEVPKRDEAYCAGVDSSENEGGGDWSAVEILKRSTRSQVAEYRIQTDLAAFSQDVILLGKFFNHGTDLRQLPHQLLIADLIPDGRRV